MRDPKVEKIFYKVSSEDGIDYKNPKPLNFEMSEIGTFNLEDGLLLIQPSVHFSTVNAARFNVEPFLRTWEMHVDLSSNFGSIRFEYRNADLIDLDPPKPGERVHYDLQANIGMSIGFSASASISLANYPSPSQAHAFSEQMEVAYYRWCQYLAGKETLLSMSYFVLTLLERIGGGRKGTAKLLNIDIKVLSEMGRLTSIKGSLKIARKATNGLSNLSSQEKSWLERATRKIILRIGEHKSDRIDREFAFSEI